MLFERCHSSVCVSPNCFVSVFSGLTVAEVVLRIGHGPGERQRESVLEQIASNLEGWTVQVKHEKAVYHTLNKLSIDVTRKVLVAEAWCPVSAMHKVRETLQQITQQSSGSVSLRFG